MRKYFKYIVALSIIASFGILVYIFIPKDTAEDTSQPKTQPTPNIPYHYQGKIQTTLNVNEKDIDIPSKVSDLRIDPKSLSENESRQIAINFGFNFEPRIINDYHVGKKLFWKDDIQYLSITLSKGTISYGHHTLPSVDKKRLSDRKIMDIAEDFLKEVVPSLAKNFKSHSIKYLTIPTVGIERTIEETDKDNAQYYRVILTPQSSDYQLITIVPGSSLFSVSILPDGSIYKLSITNIETSSNTDIEYEIKSFDEIKSSINDAKLVSVTGAFIPVSELSTDLVRSVTVNKVTFAYFADKTNINNYSPVFLLEGPIEIIGYPQNLEAQLYIPAIKTP